MHRSKVLLQQLCLNKVFDGLKKGGPHNRAAALGHRPICDLRRQNWYLS